MQNRGFTLIELMIVVAIIGIIAAAAVPMYHKYVEEAAHAEASSIMADIAAKEEAYFAANRLYIEAGNPAEPLPGFGSRSPQGEYALHPWANLNYQPDKSGGVFAGPIYYRYAVTVDTDSSSYLITARRSISDSELEMASLNKANPTVIVYTVSPRP